MKTLKFSILDFIHKHRMVVFSLILAGWVWFCYGFAIRLPFFFDDLPIMTWVARHSWIDMIISHENAYFRPLVFLIYKWGQIFPIGIRQVVLHAVNLVVLWLNLILVLRIVYLCEQRFEVAFLSAVLYGGLPFLIEPIPWVTALPHPLVTLLTLLATYTALLAEHSAKTRYWYLSLFFTLLAPLAHENGAVAGIIVGGMMVVQFGTGIIQRRWHYLGTALMLNIVVILGRKFLPGVHTVSSIRGLPFLFSNFMYFLHGLLYPFGRIVGFTVQKYALHDFSLLMVFAAFLATIVGVLVYRTRQFRWIGRSLWWWLVAAIPAMISLDYGALFGGARLYSFSGIGIAMFWAGIVVEASQQLKRSVFRLMTIIGLSAIILTQSVSYLRHVQVLYDALDDLYKSILFTVEDKALEPFGFVNVPAALIWQERYFALLTDDVIFVPWSYSNLAEFVEVNSEWRAVSAATSRSLFSETDPFWLTQGPWLEGGEMRNFVIEHATNRLGHFDPKVKQYFLRDLGNVFPNEAPPFSKLAYYENGMILERVNIRPFNTADQWEIELFWWAPGPLDATVFLHVCDVSGAVISQADGVMLGGTMVLEALHPGDRVRDVRYVTLPEGAAAPFSVFVGLYRDAERFPAYVDGVRAPDDAVFVGQIRP